MSPSADALTAAIVFEVPEAARNRNWALHETRDGASARRRARRLRGLVRQILGGYGPVRAVSVVDLGNPGQGAGDEGGEVRLGYELSRVALAREIRLSRTDLSILRVALARGGARLLPAPLVAREEDRARVDALVAAVSTAANAAAHS